jgi:hypothetical protein
MMNKHVGVEDIVFSMLREIGVPEDQIRPSTSLLEVMLDEDVTLWFIPHVVRGLGINVEPEAWSTVVTVQDVIDLLAKYPRNA